MKALVCDRPGSLSLTQRPDPIPQPGEAVIRIRRVGVCGTDFHIYGGQHPYLAYPRVMGHELAGEVVSAPSGSELRSGETVYIVPYLSCGHCRACGRGVTNACRNLSVLGVHQDGGMAEYLAVPAANAVPVEAVGLDEAAMIEFLAIGAHGVRRGAIGREDRVLVIGAGPIGMAAILFAAAAGAEVAALDLRQDRLDIAKASLGAASTYMLSDATPNMLREATGDDFFDVVIDATGNAEAIRRGLDYVGHGGRHVLLSVVRDDLVFPDPEFHKRETTLLASRNAQPPDFAAVVAYMQAGKVPTSVLNTHRALLADAPDRFDTWCDPAAGVIKAMLEL